MDKTIEEQRKQLNKRQTLLRQLMTNSEQFDAAMDMFLSHHAQLHSSDVAQPAWSFEKAVLDDMSEEKIRVIPKNEQHSVAWLLWHIARIEDVVMNLLVADSPQVFIRDGWLERLNVDLLHVGNAMTIDEIQNFSATIDVEQLLKYRAAVGRRTQEIAKGIVPQELKQNVLPDRIQKVWDEEALLAAASDVAEYWSRRTIAGLLLMPATRHNIVHLNEILNIKKRIR